MSNGLGTVYGVVRQTGAKIADDTELFLVNHACILVWIFNFIVGYVELIGIPSLDKLVVNPLSPFLNCLILFIKETRNAETLEARLLDPIQLSPEPP